MLIISSRQPSEWLYAFGFHLGASSRSKRVARWMRRLLRADCRRRVCTQETTDAARGDLSEQSMAHYLFRLLLSCDPLVRLPFCGFQTVDQGAWPSHHGPYCSDGT